MKRKIILIIVCFLLIGCGKKEEQIIDNKEEIKEDLIKLVSNDKRIVYQDEENYKVFYYEEDKVISYKIYIDYKTIDSAKNTLDIIKVNYSSNKDIKSVDREAQFIVITYNEEYVKKNYTTTEELKKTFSNLKEIK